MAVRWKFVVVKVSSKDLLAFHQSVQTITPKRGLCACCHTLEYGKAGLFANS